jgi:hypothetical protein
MFSRNDITDGRTRRRMASMASDHRRRVNIINRKHAAVPRTDGAGSGTPGRRSVLGGLVAVPVLSGLVAAVGPASAALAAQPGKVATGGDDLVRGQERRYNFPLLTPGTRLVMPAGVKAVPVLDYYHHPHSASTASAWPYIRAANGTTVDASVMPERGAPTRVAMLTNFTEGYYELTHADGRAGRVMWDASKMPYLFVYGEFGGMDEEPYRDRFYTLALQPMSRNPYLRSTSIS